MYFFVNIKQSNLIPLREKCPYSDFFWSIFSRIWTNYGDILDQETRTRKTPNTDHIHEVFNSVQFKLNQI